MNVIKKVFFIALMIWALWITSCMAATGKINAEGARIRREPNTTSDVLTIAYSGETVEILEKQGEWYKVKYGENVGYIRGDLMQVDGEAEEDTANPEETVSVQAEPEKESEETTQKEQEAVGQTQEVHEEFVEVEKRLRIDTVAKIIPSLSASKVAELKQGDKVVVIQEMNKWSCIKVEGKTAWVLTATLENIQSTEEVSAEPEPEVETKTMYISVSAAVLRAGPGTSYDPILEMYRGKPVEILSEDGEWYKVKYGEQEGYVAERLLTEQIEETHRSLITDRREVEVPTVNTVTEEEKVDNVEDVKVPEPSTNSSANQESVPAVDTATAIGDAVVSYAKQFLGCRYVYGGSGPSSFDCSGFTQYVYGHFGIALSHNAAVQANNGTYVEKSNLGLGDLVIFRDWNNTSIGHCGIYIGGGNFIHAANSTRGVVTDTLNSGYYYERYVSARRLF